MKQNAKKFGLRLGALIPAVLLVGTAVLAPCLVSAEDGGGGNAAIRDLSGVRVEGSGGDEPVAPAFGSPRWDNWLFEQPPSAPDDVSKNGYLSSGTTLCFEDFWGLTEEIVDIHWYGLSTISTVDCDPTGMEFEIIFYQDAAGSPGTPVAVFSNVIPTFTYYDTFPFWAGVSAYRFEVADLGMPVSLTNGWVSIQRTYSPNGCVFYWLTSPNGNANAIQQNGIGNLSDNLAFALTGAPPPPDVKYLHSTDGLFNLTEPLGTHWHELWPIFCREYHLSSWEDNGDGILSYCDTIDMYEKPDGELRPYHVEDVTITLLVTHNVTSESIYIELEGGYNETALMEPVGTQWHEIYPEFCREYELVAWNNTPATTGLGYCDYIGLRTPEDSITLKYLMDEDFSGAWPPSGWGTDGDWSKWLTEYAGGTSPEALLIFYNISGNYSYLDSKTVDTTSAPSLTLEFKSYIHNSCGDYNCTVYTRADGGDSWTDVTPWSNPVNSNVGPGTYSVDISSDIGSATQVRFEFDGYYDCIIDWFLDDVRLGYPATQWHVEEVAIDIIVTPEPPPVGGKAYPVSKASLLAPWIAVGVVLAGGISWYVLRRRKAQS